MEEQLRAAVLGVMHAQRRHLESCSAAHGLSAQQAISLFQLVDAGSIPMRDLSGRIGCDPSYVTGIADRLEALGLVQRLPSTDDRRVKLLVVTDEGFAMRAQLVDEVNGVTPGFSALTPPEQECLLGLLTKVLDAIGESSDTETR